jgi:hypothetical protein
MWLKVNPDMELMLEVPLQGVDEKTRDYDVQQYEEVVKEALLKKLKAVFSDDDVRIYSIAVGIAREKYAGPKAA